MSEHIVTKSGKQVFPSNQDHTRHNTGISAEDVLKNPEKALKDNTSVTNSVIESHNQKIREYNKLNESFTAIFNMKKIQELSNEADKDLSNIRSMSDYRVASEKWGKEIAGYSADPNTGKVSPEISAFISNVSRVVENKGITIGWSEASRKGLDLLQTSSTDMSLKIKQGDLAGANTHYRQTLGSLNQMEANGTIGKSVAKALRTTYQRRFNDDTMGAIQNSTLTMFNLSGHDNAKKYLKKVGRMVDIGKGSLPKQQAYSKFLKMFNEMPKEVVLKAHNKSIENFVRLGVGNPIHLMKDGDARIKDLEGMKKFGKSNEGITSMQNDIKAFKYLFTAFGDVYNKGGASKFKQLITGINSKNVNKLVANLGVKDPDVIQKFSKMYGLYVDRFNRESGGDPIKFASLIDATLGKSISNTPLEEPKTTVGVVQRDKNISSKYYGETGLSTQTQDQVMNEVVYGDPSEANLGHKQEILDTVGYDQKTQERLLKAKHGDFSADVQTFAMKFPKELGNIYPSVANTQRVKSLLKNKKGFRAVHNQLQNTLYTLGGDLEKTANIMGVSRADLAHSVGLDVAVQSTDNVAGGVNFDEMHVNPEGEDIRTKVTDLLKGKLERMREGYTTRQSGNFSIRSDSALGKGLKEWDDKSRFGGLGDRLFNKEEFNPSKSVSDLFNSAETVVDNKTKDAKLQFYKQMSDLTGLPPESFMNRLNLKQNSEDGAYHLVFKDTDDIGFINVRSNLNYGPKGKLKISEESMEKALKLKDKEAINLFIIGAILNDSKG